MAYVNLSLSHRSFRYVEPDTLRRDIRNMAVVIEQNERKIARLRRDKATMEAGVVELERQLAVERERAAARKADRKAASGG